MTHPIRIATRKSPLALKQTAMVREWLAERLPEDTFEDLRLSTQVDERLTWSLEKRGGIGLFTKELEEALLNGRATLAVHSAKDLPTAFQADLCIAGYLPRARANDVLVHREGADTPAWIASSSPRRRSQVGRVFPDAKWNTIRGNVATRLRKLADGEVEADATLLAAAGLDRLEIRNHPGLVFKELPIDAVVPAPGQAAIAIQCRAPDLPTFEGLFCPETYRAVTLERAFLRRLGGGCQTPVGAHYTAGTFYLFHPAVGHRRIDLTLDSIDQIDGLLDAVMADLNL